MGFFNFIETFFFISLGITFVLILLLVYHFKERMGALEKKSDSLLEIINNIVKELNVLRNSQMNMRTFNMFHPQAYDTIQINENPVSQEPGKIKVNITENDTEDSDEDEDDTDEDDTDEEDEDESIQDLEDFEKLHTNNIHFTYSELSDKNTDSLESNIKVITLDMEPVPHDHTKYELSSLENTGSIPSINIEEELIGFDENWENSGSLVLEGLKDNQSPIHVEKMEPLEKQLDEESTHTSNVSQEVSKEVYRKMNLHALKTFVITKGLSSDPSKMKKTELLKLIDTELFSTGSYEEKNIV
jgi:hypothetical protein